MMQQLSATKSIRVTLLAGDVHCCGVGRLFNATNPTAQDNLLIYQVVSSAIGNVPPPAAVINNVNSSAKVLDAGPANTKEEMLDLFTEDVDGKPLKKTKLLGRRNYCVIEPQDGGSSAASLVFTLQVENVPFSAPPKPYSVVIPAMA
jgi:hypothetical protein